MDDHATHIDDFRITRTDDGLRIDVLDYHAGSLLLTADVLERLGFVPATARRPATPRPPRTRAPRADAPES